MILWVWAQIKRNWGNTLKSVFGRYTDTEPLGDLSWHEIVRSCIETVQDWKNSLMPCLTNERDKLHTDWCNDWSEMGKCGFILLRWLKLLLFKVLKVTWYFVLVHSGEVWQLDAVTFSQTVALKFVHRGLWERMTSLICGHPSFLYMINVILMFIKLLNLKSCSLFIVT